MTDFWKFSRYFATIMGSQKSVSMSCGHYLCLHLKTHYLNLSGSQKSKKWRWIGHKRCTFFNYFSQYWYFSLNTFETEFGKMRIILFRSKREKKLICKHLRFSVKFVLFTIKLILDFLVYLGNWKLKLQSRFFQFQPSSYKRL